MIDLFKEIEKREKEIQGLYKYLDRLKTVQKELHVLQEASKIFELTSRELEENTGPQSEAIGPINAISNSAGAEKILRDAGKPLHHHDIHSELKKRFGKETTRGALNTALSKMFREKRIFTRPIPGTFGLIEWGFADVVEKVIRVTEELNLGEILKLEKKEGGG